MYYVYIYIIYIYTYYIFRPLLTKYYGYCLYQLFFRNKYRFKIKNIIEI